MFESLVLNVLANYLSTYFSNLTREQLRVGVWAGHIVLSDLELRLDAFARLPVRLTRGTIGRLQIRVPWSRLRSESIVIQVEDVVLLTSLPEAPEPEAHRALQHHQATLRAAHE